MNLLKMVFGGLGAVMLTAGSIWAFAEPTPPPVTATPLTACAAGKCGSHTCPASKCDAAVNTVATNCKDSACPTAANACGDKTIPVAVVTKSKNAESDCSAGAKSCCKSECDAAKTIPVAVTDACCKAEGACVTKSACKSSKCDGKADGCDGECCKVGKCKSACCTDKVSADASPSAKKDCCDKTVPVSVTKSECQDGACPVSAKSCCKSECSEKGCDGKCCKEGACKSKCCTKKTSAKSCPAGKCCDEKTIPVAVTESECKGGSCPANAKSCCESKCSAGDKECDGKCCKEGTCKSECCTKKTSAKSCPAGKCCDEKTIPVAVTKSNCQDKEKCSASDDSCDTSNCDGKKCDAAKSECGTAKVAAVAKDCCAEEKCCDSKSTCQVAEKCSKSDGCEAACPTSRKPIVAESPEDAVRNYQSYRTGGRVRIGIGLHRGPVVRLMGGDSPSQPATCQANHCRPVDGGRKIALVLIRTCIQTMAHDNEEREPTLKVAPPPQRAEPVGVARYPSHSRIVGDRDIVRYGADCPHGVCPMQAHRPSNIFPAAELGPPMVAHGPCLGRGCPVGFHGQCPAFHPPAFHRQPVGMMGPPPLHFDEFVTMRIDRGETWGPHFMGRPAFDWEPMMPPPLPLPMVFHAPYPVSGPPVAWGPGTRMHPPLWRTEFAPAPPREQQHHQLRSRPPRIPIQAVSFEGDAPVPGIHPRRDAASRSRHRDLSIIGSWVQQVGGTTIRVTCEPSRIQGTATIAADGANEPRTIEFSGTCSVTPDGQLFGVIDHLSINGLPEGDTREGREFESRMVDQPFAIRFRADGDELFVKDMKCAGIATLDFEESDDGVNFLNLFACGKYTRDGK